MSESAADGLESLLLDVQRQVQALTRDVALLQEERAATLLASSSPSSPPPPPRSPSPLPSRREEAPDYPADHPAASIALDLSASSRPLRKLKETLYYFEECMFKISNDGYGNLMKHPKLRELKRAGELVEGPTGCDFQIQTSSYFASKIASKCAWLPLPDSVIGLEVGIIFGKYQLLEGKFSIVRVGAIFFTVLCFLVQFYVIICLWQSLPDLDHNPDFCQNEQVGRKLQLCAVSVFLVSINQAFKDITLEILVILTSTKLKRDCFGDDVKLVRKATGNLYWQREDLVHIRVLDKEPAWVAFGLVICLVELTVWCLTLVVGCKYLLASATVSDLVQSMVSIVFINDIDNLAFAVFVPRNVRRVLEKFEFECPYLKGPGKPGTDRTLFSKEWFQNKLYVLSLLGSVPIVVVVAVGVVYGLHDRYC